MQAGIRESGYIDINGKKQFLSVRSDGEKLPVLLYLHGGPGDAALPLVAKYNRSLEKYFTVAVWEQRGAGKSYYPFREDEEITISVFIRDIYEITEYLLCKYSQDKLYLAGHSWGSVLGLTFCQNYPEKLYAYIGCGQVVNMKRSSRLACDYVMRQSEKERNTKKLDRLKNIDCTYSSDHWLEELLFVTRQVVHFKGSLYSHKNYAPLVRDVILSGEYSITELLNRQKGALQSIKRLWQELMTVNFEDVTSFSVPVVLIEGRYDYHVSSKLAEEYFRSIVSEKRFYWFERSGHFPQWSEAERFTEVLGIDVAALGKER